MGSPTVNDVHVPTAIGNKKGKRQMAGKARMDQDDTMMGKKLGNVPPQFLPKQGKGAPAKAGKAASRTGKMGGRGRAKMGKGK